MLIRRAGAISFGINDYAHRLSDTESENRRMEDSLISARKLEDWSRMSTTISHEISNPLEAIQNLLYLIRTSDGATPEIASLAAAAGDESARVMALTRSSLSFFRQSGRPEPVDLHAAAQSVRFLLDPIVQKQLIVVDIEASGEVTVEAYPGETRQVLLNLVRNACEATNTPGSHVTIRLTGSASCVEIVIADQGTGIDPALMASLFEFGRSTKGENGNGMGLWTVRQILNRHGGDIDVRSTIGSGTTFTIQWPRKCATAQPAMDLPASA